MSKPYDTLYQKWLDARYREDYDTADTIRDQFEYLHGLTIYAEGDKPEIGITVRQMPLSKYLRKYHKQLPTTFIDYREVSHIISTTDSKISTPENKYTLPADLFAARVAR